MPTSQNLYTGIVEAVLLPEQHQTPEHHRHPASVGLSVIDFPHLDLILGGSRGLDDGRFKHGLDINILCGIYPGTGFVPASESDMVLCGPGPWLWLFPVNTISSFKPFIRT